ncbi:hypothetical protein PHLCEN_2v9185 [Hermanssonia centrifuga]|uniref:Uncharacterized protein n=1 Tax=Hermanssonia centrifuga TaxID=98765 RepID=A0A2R6NRG1_9APHY|nr:hypothetical protein PHLCEN_2v9185 [Hermanssonia centrifuga]
MVVSSTFVLLLQPTMSIDSIIHSERRNGRSIVTITILLITALNVLLNTDTVALSLPNWYTVNNLVVDRPHPRDSAATWDVGPIRQATMTPEESVHYKLNTVAGEEEWSTILPHGRGVVYEDREGEETPYRLAMFHQLECLAAVREEMMARQAGKPVSERARFCLNYLRQSIQCHSDAHLEMVRSEYGGRAVLPYTTRTNCLDWEAIWGRAESHFHSRRNNSVTS